MKQGDFQNQQFTLHVKYPQHFLLNPAFHWTCTFSRSVHTANKVFVFSMHILAMNPSEITHPHSSIFLLLHRSITL